MRRAVRDDGPRGNRLGFSKVEPVETVSALMQEAGVRDPDGNAVLLHNRYKPYDKT